MGANPAQTLKAIQEAEAYPGPSLIIGYSPCEMHSIKGGMDMADAPKAIFCPQSKRGPQPPAVLFVLKKKP